MKIQAIEQKAVAGAIFITNVVPTTTGNIPSAFKKYATIETVSSLQSFQSDTPWIDVSYEVDGGPAKWRPTVMITTPKMPAKAHTPTRMAGSARRWLGTISLEAPYAGPIIAETDLGAVASVEYTPAFAGPKILTVVLGVNPGSQSELKENDTITISGTCEADAANIEVVNTGIFKSGTGTVVSGAFSFVGTVSNRIGTITATLRCSNAMGTYGDNFETAETKFLNHTYPTVTIGTITYPVTQSALKNIEAATVVMITANLTTIGYTNNGTGEISITNPSTNETPKTVQRTGGSYRETGNNFKVVANRAENDATTTKYACIKIANVAPTIDISGMPVRAWSSPGGVAHSIMIASSQRLVSEPTLLASIGALGAYTGGPNTWNSTLTIVDADVKGAGSFGGLVATNEANLAQNTINSGATYTCGGFTLRTINFAGSGDNIISLGTAVYDVTKLTAILGAVFPMTYYNDLAEHIRGYTITNAVGTLDSNGSYLRILESALVTGDAFFVAIDEGQTITMALRPK